MSGGWEAFLIPLSSCSVPCHYRHPALRPATLPAGFGPQPCKGSPPVPPRPLPTPPRPRQSSVTPVNKAASHPLTSHMVLLIRPLRKLPRRHQLTGARPESSLRCTRGPASCLSPSDLPPLPLLQPPGSSTARRYQDAPALLRAPPLPPALSPQVASSLFLRSAPAALRA